MNWQTLAPELIYEILSQCRASVKILSVTSFHSFPWYLGDICKSWREVFVSSPRFWNTLEINLNFDDPWSPLYEELYRERALELARISLVRSRNCPISFRLTVSGYFQASAAEITMCRQMIEILVANSARWRDAYINIPVKEMATLYTAKNRMPLLRSIQLELQTGHRMPVLPFPNYLQQLQTFRSSSAMKLYSDFLVDTARLTRICFKEYSPFWKIKESLITVVHFYTAPPLPQLLAYLSEMSCLEELVFLGKYVAVGDNTLNNGIAPITLPHLKFLYSITITLLLIIETPALLELHIRNDISMIENASAYKANISRYFRRIRHLSKLRIRTDYREDNTALIIAHMPREARVDHLSLYSDSSMSDLLKILEDYPQIRSLKTVTFEFSTIMSELAKDILLETVTSWKKEIGKDRGIGPFHNLTHMSFNLLDDYDRRFVDSLKLHLEKQDMHYSIRKDESDFWLPKFHVL